MIANLLVVNSIFVLYTYTNSINDLCNIETVLHMACALDFVMPESVSDRCIGELMGTDKVPACQISDSCVSLMTQRGHRDYDITHQLLYLMIAQQVCPVIIRGNV